jgi:hypothetical protein
VPARKRSEREDAANCRWSIDYVASAISPKEPDYIGSWTSIGAAGRRLRELRGFDINHAEFARQSGAALEIRVGKQRDRSRSTPQACTEIRQNNRMAFDGREYAQLSALRYWKSCGSHRTALLLIETSGAGLSSPA